MNPPQRETRTTGRPRKRVQVGLEPPRLASPTSSSALAPSAMSKSKPRPQSSREQPQEEENVRPLVGQLSATQTMVVTTTTTTTTSYPPLLLNPPRHLHEMDPKHYPLAAAPTPPSMKKFHFDVGGRRTTFEEANSPKLVSEKTQDPAKLPDREPLRALTQTYHDSSTPTSHAAGNPSQNIQTSFQTPQTMSDSGRKRPASPVSISEAALRARQNGSRKRRMISGAGVDGPSASTRNASSSRLRSIQTSTPLTPNVGSNEVSRERPSSAGATQHTEEPPNPSKPSSKSSSTLDGSDDEDCNILSPQSAVTRSMSFQDEEASRSSAMLDQTPWNGADANHTVTPSAEEEPEQAESSFTSTTGQRHPRPGALNTTAVQDASLPSPSLSPVTAAASLHNRRHYFDQAGTNYGRTRASSGRRSLELQKLVTPPQPTHTPLDSQNSSLIDVASQDVDDPDPQVSNAALMKLPEMIDTFEAMPEEMKSYIMYQMLRRCSKPVLHFVASTVNPALKCDFLRLLPVELCINIIGYLDVKSLCAAAQVSKRWRRLIDSSEKVWKRLFDVDGYQLQDGELQRAIREGWGWQFASNFGEYEKDLSTLAAVPSDTEIHTTSLIQAAAMNAQKQPTALQNKRSKRKAKPRSKVTSRKQLKSSHSFSASSMDMDDEAFLDMASSAEGPYAAATAAAAAVPYPGIGLPTLRNLHLFKSIYMRHHIIKNTWMNDEVAPRHIAFRAHQRHVVTCLQFDSDKILTGSDDSNINVYDTQTGALRATLEGHEGGVWALQYQGNVLVSGSTDRSVRVWDIEHGVCTQTFQGHTSTVRCLQILSPTQIGRTSDGRPIMMPKQPLIITGSRDSSLRVWKLPKPGDPTFHQAGPAADETNNPYYVKVLNGHHHSVRAIAAHADTLVSGSYDFTVRVWKISTGETLHRLQGHTQKVYSVVLDHKRNRCISGSMDNVVRVWSLETGTALFNLEGHLSLVGLLDLQEDRLVSAAADSTLRIWDPENGQCKWTLSAHTGAITCFQHDGQKVISGSDRTLKMWDVTTGEFVKDLLTDLSGVWQVKFNERRCVAAVQRNNLTYIEVLDFGALRDGVPENKRGRRIIVNGEGRETFELHDGNGDGEVVED